MKKFINILAVVMISSVFGYYFYLDAKELPEIIIEEASEVSVASLPSNLEKLLDAIQQVENPSKSNELIGDQHLSDKAYGIYQIRQPLLDDINRIVGKEVIKELWGKEYLVIEDVKDSVKARWCAKMYLIHYGRVYQRQTGNMPCLATYARIYNGGPYGWRKDSTNAYVSKIFEQYN